MRQINPWAWQDQFGYAQAVVVPAGRDVLYCAGQTSMDAAGRPLHAGDMRAQLCQALNNLEAVLAAAGADLGGLVRLNLMTTDVDALFACYDVLLSRLARAGARPAMTLLGVERLAFPQLLVEIEATALAPAVQSR
jgi:enamine deaminase RidA (YjgF/YER057c/UK114 family)